MKKKNVEVLLLRNGIDYHFGINQRNHAIDLITGGHPPRRKLQHPKRLNFQLSFSIKLYLHWFN